MLVSSAKLCIILILLEETTLLRQLQLLQTEKTDSNLPMTKEDLEIVLGGTDIAKRFYVEQYWVLVQDF
jgi:hypothetical protein